MTEVNVAEPDDHGLVEPSFRRSSGSEVFSGL